MAKNTKKKGVIRRIASDVTGRDRAVFAGLIVIIGIAKLCLSIAPRLSGRITDALAASAETGDFDTGYIASRCVLLAFLFLIGYGVDGVVNRSMVRISQKLAKKLRNRAQQKLNHVTMGFLDTHPVGDTLSRVTNDMVSMSNSLESTASNLIGQLILVVGLIIMMLVTNYKLALIYLIVLPLGFSLTALVVKTTNKLFRQQNQTMGDLNALVSDSYSNHMLIKAYGCEEEKTGDFKSKNKRFYDTYVKSRFLSGFVIPLSVMVNNVAYVCLCIIGGIMLLNKKLTLGEFQAFIFFGNMIGSPLSSLSSSMNNIQTGLTAAERVYELIDEEEEPAENPSQKIVPENVKGEVTFSHVKFGYLADKQLMNDVSFTASPGQTMAIVGPSGAGKTTLINLLMRFYEIWDGKILVDGIPADEVLKSELRSTFGMVLQDTWIFDGTVADNIGYGKKGATREEIIKAARMVQCDSFIEKLPDGYDTRISEENSALSAGEKQLIAIARAVISDPKILILDEATSQVDTKTEALITQAMERMMEGRTSFIIAHRLYTIRNADKIIFMVDGDIKEVGSHEELLAKRGLYAAMYNSGTSMG
ncbi:MAG: ABC transporter ATP-binding protein [Lachnospiraceae bacterium]|nr:ABC transporter ATP-binding protein [Lachnospiraceae bacterium]